MNTNKTYTFNQSGLTVHYTDTKRHYSIPVNIIHNRPLFQNKTAFKKSERSSSFTYQQERMYKVALTGIKAYTAHEIQRMNFRQKVRIHTIHSKSQRVLNLWKQELINNAANDFLLKLFPHSKLAQKMTSEEYSKPDPNVSSDIPLFELGITRQDVVNKLIEKGIYSKEDFYNNPHKKAA